MQYITFDAAGNTTGAFIQDLQPEHAASYVEATDAQYANWTNLIVVNGALVERPAPPPQPLDRSALAARIDAAVIAIYDKPMLLSKEYEAREAAAQAFKDAGYAGAVPARVNGFATPAGMTAQAATDLILSQAAQLRGALDSLSDLRMQKYLVTRAATDSDAQAAFDTTMSQIATIATALG